METTFIKKVRLEMKRSHGLLLAPVLAFLLLGSGPVLAGGQAADKDVASLMDAYLRGVP